jgi:pimeloyl-ACP methyl ester carboxylesterase
MSRQLRPRPELAEACEQQRFPRSQAPTSMSSSTPPAAYTEEWLAGPASTSFYTRLYTPPAPARAALVFAHGFVEHVGRYAHVFPAWAAAGVAVLAFDQRGFGRTALDAQRSAGSSYGRTDNAAQRADLRWALDETRRRWPGVPLFLMGHSMARSALGCGCRSDLACRAAASSSRSARSTSRPISPG